MTRLLALLLLILAADGVVRSAGAQSGDEEDTSILRCQPSHALDRRTGKPAPSGCGQRIGPSRVFRARVTGGEAAPDERYTAAIFYLDDSGKRHICTGVLVDARHLLTAGHCGCGIKESYRVTFNQFARRGERIVDEVGVEGAPILFDPMTCVGGAAPGNDLALIRLDRSQVKHPRNFGYPILLVEDYRNQMKPEQTLLVVGYGETEKGTIATRMKARVPILTPDCFDSPHRFYCAPFQEMITADRRGTGVPRDTCDGDSGGPVYIRTVVKLPICDGSTLERTPYENQPDDDWKIVEQDVLVAVTSRAAPFAQPLAGQHCGGGAINTLVGRKSVHAWLDANRVRRQRCNIKPTTDIPIR